MSKNWEKNKDIVDADYLNKQEKIINNITKYILSDEKFKKADRVGKKVAGRKINYNLK